MRPTKLGDLTPPVHGGAVVSPVGASEHSALRESSQHASSILASLVPRCTVVSATFAELEVPLLPEELERMRNAVPSRFAEYRTVRACARAAMAELGVRQCPLVSGNRGEPLWPAGIVGSLTHCEGYRAAVVGQRDCVGCLGIDAEPNLPLPVGVASAVMGRAEADQLGGLLACGPDVAWDRLLFSAKESIYKAWFPLTGAWLGFDDVHLRIDPVRRTFEGRVVERLDHRDGAPTSFEGGFSVEAGLIVTAVGSPRIT